MLGKGAVQGAEPGELELVVVLAGVGRRGQVGVALCRGWVDIRHDNNN